MIRLRQVAWAASDLAAAERSVVDLLGLERCYRDPGVGVFGLDNALFPVGDQFLEIVAPLADAGETAAGRHLARRNGDAGYMVILQTTDLEAVLQRADDAAVRVIFEAEGGNDAEGTTTRGIHFHPKDVGGAILSIDETRNVGEWAWAGPVWRNHRTERVIALRSVTIEVADPAASARVWAELAGASVDETRPVPTVVLDDAELVFVAGDRGVIGIGVEVNGEPIEAELLGTTITTLDGPPLQH